MKSLFVSVVGQDDNIGDSALRRGMLDSIRDEGIQYHVFIGNASPEYVSGLHLAASDVIYREREEWLESMRVPRGRGVTSFLANAGEIVRLSGPRYFGGRQLMSLARVRRTGGALVQTGAGIRNLSPQRLAKWSALRQFDIVTWRDPESQKYSGTGVVSPDWGFATLGSHRLDETPLRDTLAVSIRGDGPAPDAGWLAAVETLARGLGAKIVVVVQVKRDGARARRLAHEFRAELLGWDDQGHHEQETRVREVYRRSIAVVSDRLHGLILGATEGAYPIGLPPRHSSKIERTLAPLSFGRYLPDGQSAGTLASLEAAELTTEVQRAVASARAELAVLAEQVRGTVMGR